QRLRELSASPDADFSRYLESGDAALLQPRLRRGRSSFNWNQKRYLGSFFEDIAWPAWLTGFERPAKGGVFFWGVEEEIINSLQPGQLTTLEFSLETHASVVRQEQTVAIVSPDRTLLIWGYSLQDLEAVESEPPREEAGRKQKERP